MAQCPECNDLCEDTVFEENNECEQTDRELHKCSMNKNRKKLLELLKTHPEVHSLDALLSQLIEQVQQCRGRRTEQHHTSLEDIINTVAEFKEYEIHLSNFIMHRERLIDVLGAVGEQPDVISKQLQQVEILQDELTSEEPAFSNLEATGHSIISWCHENSFDTSDVYDRMRRIHTGFKKLQGHLKERKTNIESMRRLTEKLRSMSHKQPQLLGESTETIGCLSKVSRPRDKQQAGEEKKCSLCLKHYDGATHGMITLRCEHQLGERCAKKFIKCFQRCPIKDCDAKIGYQDLLPRETKRKTVRTTHLQPVKESPSPARKRNITVNHPECDKALLQALGNISHNEGRPGYNNFFVFKMSGSTSCRCPASKKSVSHCSLNSSESFRSRSIALSRSSSDSED